MQGTQDVTFIFPRQCTAVLSFHEVFPLNGHTSYSYGLAIPPPVRHWANRKGVGEQKAIGTPPPLRTLDACPVARASGRRPCPKSRGAQAVSASHWRVIPGVGNPLPPAPGAGSGCCLRRGVFDLRWTGFPTPAAWARGKPPTTQSALGCLNLLGQITCCGPPRSTASRDGTGAPSWDCGQPWPRPRARLHSPLRSGYGGTAPGFAARLPSSGCALPCQIGHGL